MVPRCHQALRLLLVLLLVYTRVRSSATRQWFPNHRDCLPDSRKEKEPWAKEYAPAASSQWSFQEGPTNGMARTGLWPSLSIRDLDTLQLLSIGKREGK